MNFATNFRAVLLSHVPWSPKNASVVYGKRAPKTQLTLNLKCRQDDAGVEAVDVLVGVRRQTFQRPDYSEKLIDVLAGGMSVNVLISYRFFESKNHGDDCIAGLQTLYADTGHALPERQRGKLIHFPKSR